MRVVIFGSRYKDASQDELAALQIQVWNRIKRLPRHAFVITGGAGGVDTWAENARKAQGLDGEVIPAEWRVNGVYNPQAGFERNSVMLGRLPSLAIGFWDGKSNGTKDTMKKAAGLGIQVELHENGTVTDDWHPE